MPQFNYKHDVWDSLRSHVAADDGLPVNECGTWTIEKLYFLGHYLSLVTNTMTGKCFSSVNYVDLFCGPGVDVVRSQKVEPRYPGSPLLAAACPKPFDRIVLVDDNAERVDAAVSRVRAYGCTSDIVPFSQDANVVASAIANAIPERALTIVFVDPYSLGIRFETVRKIASRGCVDFLILFADRMDAGRNLLAYYASGKSPKLDDFLGDGSHWRDRYDALDNHEPDRVRRFLAGIYIEQLHHLGYGCTRTKEIAGDHGPLYRLVYASKNPAGLKFWDIATSYRWDGSQDLFSI